MSRRVHDKPHGFTLVELMIVVGIIGVLAAIAIPNMMKYQARSKQSEARTNLKAYFTVQRNFFSEKDSYSTEFSVLGFAPERGNRYAYLAALAPTKWLTRSTDALPVVAGSDGIEVDCWKIGVGGCTAQPARPADIALFTVVYGGGASGPPDTGVLTGANGGFVIEARGSVDNDPESDVWLVSSGSIVVGGNLCADAVGGVAGIPVQVFNDVSCP